MSDNVVELASRRPHLSGTFRCMGCKHEWITVCPLGTVWLDCPSCGCTKGLMKYIVLRDVPNWECLCGNDLFYITPDGPYCPNCGEWHKVT